MIDRLLHALKRLLAVAIAAIVLWVAAFAYLGGESTSVTARNVGGEFPMTTRTLDPAARPTSTLPQYGPEKPTLQTAGEDGGLWVIDGNHAYPLPRTPEIVQALWLATHYYR